MFVFYEDFARLIKAIWSHICCRFCWIKSWTGLFIACRALFTLGPCEITARIKLQLIIILWRPKTNNDIVVQCPKWYSWDSWYANGWIQLIRTIILRNSGLNVLNPFMVPKKIVINANIITLQMGAWSIYMHQIQWYFSIET